MSLNRTRTLLLMTASTVLVTMLTGCATNPYHDYYKATPIPEYEKQHLQYLPEEGAPKLTASSGDTASELDEALSHGFVIIGTSTFNAPLIETEKLAEQAKDVGATHVLYSAKQAGKVTGFAPQAMTEDEAQALSEETTRQTGLPSTNPPSIDTSYDKVDSAGNKEEPFWGLGYLPVSYNKQRFNQSATFLVKSSKVPALGVETQSLNADQKQRLGFNRGVVVKRVFYDSPGFAANLKKGDILYSVNGIVIKDARHFQAIAKSYSGAGRLMVFEVLRGTEPLQITLNPAAKGARNTPLLLEQADPSTGTVVPEGNNQASNDAQTTEALKTPEEKREEAAQRWAARKKAYEARIQKKQARSKDGFFMGLFHSMTDWISSDD